MAVQADFGDDSPVIQAAFAETVDYGGLTWGIGQPPGQPAIDELRFATARIGGYMIHISGSESALEAMMSGVDVEVGAAA